MEETKNPNMKVVEKEEQPQEHKRATYEELNNYCMQLYNQNKQLMEQLRQKEAFNLFKRLEFLFLVLSNKDSLDKDFVESCAKEIQQALTLQEDKPKEEEEKKGE